MQFEISPLVIPASVDSSAGSDFAEMVRVRNEIEADAVGNYDLAYEPAELLPMWQRSWEHKVMNVARVDGRIVGRAIYEYDDASSRTAWLSVEVLTAFRRQGIGSALYDTLVEMARSDGKTVLQGYVPQKVTPGPSIPAPTGFGSVPRDSASTRFLLARGYVLEQVERMSRLDLPFNPPPMPPLGEYHLESWTGRTPVAFLSAIAALRTGMQTDAPTAGLEPETNPWTAARVSEEDDGLENSPRTTLTTLAVHTATGSPAGFTELAVPLSVARPVAQGDTIVLRAHRGHRLGMILKLANLALLPPGHPSVTTFNAEENRPMLSVNEQIGFVAWGYEGAWRAEL